MSHSIKHRLLRVVLALAGVVCGGGVAVGQTLNFFDVDASGWPRMKGKFYAFEKGGLLQRPTLGELSMKENGVARTIIKVTCPEVKPPKQLSAVLVLDISGSMGWKKGTATNLDVAKTAANAFVQAMPLDSAECAVTSFDNYNFLNQDFTNDKAVLHHAINSLKARGGTDYNAALIRVAAGGLRVSARGKHQRVIIMLTDGTAQIPQVDSIIKVANDQNCVIYIVTLGMQCPQSLRDIAARTGGQFFENVVTAQDAETVYQSILQIAQENEPCEVEWESVVTCQSVNLVAALRWDGATGLAAFLPPTGSGPGVTANPTTVKFGAITPGTVKDTTITITAVQTDFIITKIAITSGASVYSVVGETFPFSLLANTSKQIKIRYAPIDSSLNYGLFELEAGGCPSFFSVLGGYAGKPMASQTLRLIQPNGGELYVVGADTVIKWTGVSPSDRVGLEYTIDGGVQWIPITDSAVGLAYEWKKIPLPASTTCLVRVSQWAESGKIEVAPEILWQQTVGGSNHDEFKSIQQTFDGGYIAAGNSRSSNGSVGLNKGDRDCWIVKFNSIGTIQWHRVLGGSNGDEVNSIQQTRDGGYIFAGGTFSANGDIGNSYGRQDAWVVKLSSAGNVTWERSFGGAENDVAFSVQETRSGGYVVAGESQSTFPDGTLNQGFSDFWIFALDANGNQTWQKTYGGSGNESAKCIKQTSDGGFIVVGETSSRNGDVKVARGSADFWVVKLDSLGRLVWEKTFGGSSTDAAQSVLQTEDDSYVVVGSSSSINGDVTNNHGSQDFWVVKMNGLGNILWQRSFGGAEYDAATDVQYTADGGYIVTGSTSSFSGNVTLNKGISDVWLLKLTSDGKIDWQKTIGGSEADVGYSVLQTSDNGFIVGGYTGSANGDVTSKKGGGDAWIVKLGAQGSPVQQDTSDAQFEIAEPEFSATEIDMKLCFVGNVKDSVIAPFIINAGKVSCRIDSIYFRGPDAKAFSLLSGIPVFVADAGAKLPSEFVFKPSRAGLHSADIVVVSQSDTMTVNIRGTGVLPLLKVMSDIVDFGVVAIGDKKDSLQVATIRNVGSAQLVVTQYYHAGPNAVDFSTLTKLPGFNLSPGEEVKVDLRFAPSTVGRTSGELLFGYLGHGSPARVQLFGEGVRSAVSVVNNVIDYGRRKVGSQNDTLQEVTIKNVGKVPIDITSVKVVAGGSPEFSILNGGEVGGVLMPDSVMLMDVRYSPTRLGVVTSEMHFEFNGVGSPAVVELRGQGTGSSISILNSEIDFGSHQIGAFKDSVRAQTIENIGSVDIQINSVNIIGRDAAAFSIENGTGNPFILKAGDTATIDVRFEPLAIGPLQAELSYEFVGAGSPASVQLTGSGIGRSIVIRGTQIDFGTLSVGMSRDSLQVATIANVGSDDVYISAIRVVGTDASDFILLNSSDAPFVLQAGVTATIDGRFTARKNGIANAELQYEYVGGLGPMRIPLIGRGIIGSIATQNSVIDFARRIVGSVTDTLQVGTIQNIGTANVEITAARIVGQSAGDFFILNATDVVSSIAAGQLLGMDISYRPTQASISSAEILLDYIGEGSPARVTLLGEAVPLINLANIQIEVGDHSAVAGQEVLVPISLRITTPVKPSADANIQLELMFNPTLLYPLDLPMQTIDATTAFVTLSNLKVGTLAIDQLATVRFYSGLGNAPQSPLTLRNSSIDSTPNTITSIDLIPGNFTLLGICTDGGTRLINPTGQPAIASVHPNPTSRAVEIHFEVVERSFTELYITDGAGRRVHTVIAEEPSVFGIRSATIPRSALSVGQYWIILKTPTTVRSEKLVVSD